MSVGSLALVRCFQKLDRLSRTRSSDLWCAFEFRHTCKYRRATRWQIFVTEYLVFFSYETRHVAWFSCEHPAVLVSIPVVVCCSSCLLFCSTITFSLYSIHRKRECKLAGFYCPGVSARLTDWIPIPSPHWVHSHSFARYWCFFFNANGYGFQSSHFRKTWWRLTFLRVTRKNFNQSLVSSLLSVISISWAWLCTI